MMEKTFKIRLSDRRIPLTPEALDRYAPRLPGVYRFHLLTSHAKIEILFVGLTRPGQNETIHTAIASHMMGNVRPTKADLLREGKDVYFDYILNPDTSDPRDLEDIAGRLITKDRPRLNPTSPPPSSGRYVNVLLEGIS